MRISSMALHRWLQAFPIPRPRPKQLRQQRPPLELQQPQCRHHHTGNGDGVLVSWGGHGCQPCEMDNAQYSCICIYKISSAVKINKK